MKRHFLLYGHGGSYNHGAEAIIHSTIGYLRRIAPGCHITLASHFPEQDRAFGISAEEIIGRDLEGKTHEEVYAESIARITPNSVCLHVGGDNYCYPNWQRYAAIHYKALERGAKSVLWSCSLEPNLIDDKMFEVVRTHHLITARESVTYSTLVQRGLENVFRVTDIAFSLEPCDTQFPIDHYISINLSPLVMRKNPLMPDALSEFIDYVLRNTDYMIALVPHVTACVDNDREALEALNIEKSRRVFHVQGELSAAQYKSIIGGSRFAVCSRTHAAIAAYSSGVPTIALGYSTKALGIARDLDMEAFHIDCNGLNSSNSLISMFRRLEASESSIRAQLEHLRPNLLRNAVNVNVLMD